MSALAALDRLAQTVEPMTHKQRAEYMFLALMILGANAPDVLPFILDRTDERIGGAA